MIRSQFYAKQKVPGDTPPLDDPNGITKKEPPVVADLYNASLREEFLPFILSFFSEMISLCRFVIQISHQDIFAYTKVGFLNFSSFP